MKSTKKKLRGEQKDIAAERVAILFSEADRAAHAGDFSKADAWIKQARDIAMKSNLKLRREEKRRFCKFCYSYLLPSVSSKVRVNSDEKRVEVRCLRCNRLIYYPYASEVKERRKRK